MNYSVSGSNLWNELIENTGNSTPERWHIQRKMILKNIGLHCIVFILFWYLSSNNMISMFYYITVKLYKLS